jgi:hypothetical protein
MWAERAKKGAAKQPEQPTVLDGEVLVEDGKAEGAWRGEGKMEEERGVSRALEGGQHACSLFWLAWIVNCGFSSRGKRSWGRHETLKDYLGNVRKKPELLAAVLDLLGPMEGQRFGAYGNFVAAVYLLWDELPGE